MSATAVAVLVVAVGFLHALSFTTSVRLSVSAGYQVPVLEADELLALLSMTIAAGFPEKYRDAILRAVDHCAVKRLVLDPPEFEIEVR